MKHPPISLILVFVFLALFTTVSINPWAFAPGSSFISEKIKITNFEFISISSISLTVQNDDEDKVTFVNAYVHEQVAPTDEWNNGSFLPCLFREGVVLAGTSANFTVTLNDGKQFNQGETYCFRLVTTKGNTASYTVVNS